MKKSNNYWLLKSEPESYSIDDLKREGKTRWSGVRNYQARNYMRDSIQVGDTVLIYHSSIKIPAIVGLGVVLNKAIADPTQFDITSQYFDEKSSIVSPKWWAIEVKFLRKFKKELTLSKLKTIQGLNGMTLLSKGSRLSIQAVKPSEFDTIIIIESQE
jgi:predicted RNA-binding protein with PUA-like domain